MGLQVLYPCNGAGQAEVVKVEQRHACMLTPSSVVAVHGLNGDPKNTWTNDKTHAFWLKDFLPRDVPNARVMTFGYNADAAFSNSTSDIIDHAKSLLSSLVDEREEKDEMLRPIVFVGHSLGGIVIKQALFQARIEQRYSSISKSTIGIIFLGTPHRGSEKAAYGKLLATLAATVMNRPPPRLLNALQTNSSELMRLTTDFRFQLPRYEVFSFYETKPVGKLSTLVVEKHSALLEIDGEEQIPVNLNHLDMCKFTDRDDEVYKKLFKRIRRLIKEENTSLPDSSHADRIMSSNRHYCVPYDPTGIYTGRDNVLDDLHDSCLPPTTANGSTMQKRFILYGLGGSGKTQTCLKFAQEYRERFWGIFWIDASSRDTAHQGLLEVARILGLGEDTGAVKQWLSNSLQPWLLILDNADDPSMDVSEFFPAGNRGTILVTTRNPECKIHATVGSCEYGGMDVEEAITLLLRAAGVEDTDDRASREAAAPVAKILGWLALAIVQACAYVRKGLCRIDEYCDIYSRHREKLLSYRSVQGQSEYQHTVYTTWEISIEAIKKQPEKCSSHAIELIGIFSFLHYEGIREDIFELAHKNIHNGIVESNNITDLHCTGSPKDQPQWDPMVFREAASLLASFSLIKIEEMGRRISMHPLVHVWARDCLSDSMQRQYWTAASSIVAAAITDGYQVSDYQFRRSLVPHIDSCVSLCKDRPFISAFSGPGRIYMGIRFAKVFEENGRLLSAFELREKIFEASQRTLGHEHPDTLTAMANLAIIYKDLGRRKEAMELEEKVFEARQRTLGHEHPDTLDAMTNLAISYGGLGRRQEAMELEEKVFEARQRTLGHEHPDTRDALTNLAILKGRSGFAYR
ncbi:hypothetical protein MAA_10501 [Metarhizium robertsii ARSEF 23]|uniref:DUF676 domain-containing protein n=1 Tax=Metarhizium robertsii (strain ARSEF 23 / ATCC MYA-3075) TaxID=655844 RepID=E9FE02_METRA|nr:uncharacterized protein MAA_10501 [Metarhizium robertsii ARSEF 23]EFY94038.2 hypothetical protein MAA_10501 [Metarhizium robertsii ARSEF 23]